MAGELLARGIYPNSEDSFDIAIVLPSVASNDVINVCHLTLPDLDRSEFVARNESLERSEFLIESLLVALVPSVSVTFGSFPPVLDTPIRLELEQLGALAVQKAQPRRWWVLVGSQLQAQLTRCGFGKVLHRGLQRWPRLGPGKPFDVLLPQQAEVDHSHGLQRFKFNRKDSFHNGR